MRENNNMNQNIYTIKVPTIFASSHDVRIFGIQMNRIVARLNGSNASFGRIF